MLYERVNFNYIPVYTPLIRLSEEEWEEMIKLFINKLAETTICKIIYDKLNYFCSLRYSITFTNWDHEYNSTIFPKIRYVSKNSVLIVIPNVPYFTMAEVIDGELCKDTDDLFLHNLEKVSNGLPSNQKIIMDDYKCLISYEKIPGFISFCHELIHCLRFFENKNNLDLSEEDNTIYGINEETLSYKIDDKIYYITENAVRKEYGLKSRISHDSKELFCYGVRSTYDNASKFSISDFY